MTLGGWGRRHIYHLLYKVYILDRTNGHIYRRICRPDPPPHAGSHTPHPPSAPNSRSPGGGPPSSLLRGGDRWAWPGRCRWRGRSAAATHWPGGRNRRRLSDLWTFCPLPRQGGGQWGDKCTRADEDGNVRGAGMQRVTLELQPTGDSSSITSAIPPSASKRQSIKEGNKENLTFSKSPPLPLCRGLDPAPRQRWPRPSVAGGWAGPLEAVEAGVHLHEDGAPLHHHHLRVARARCPAPRGRNARRVKLF